MFELSELQNAQARRIETLKITPTRQIHLGNYRDVLNI